MSQTIVPNETYMRNQRAAMAGNCILTVMEQKNQRRMTDADAQTFLALVNILDLLASNQELSNATRQAPEGSEAVEITAAQNAGLEAVQKAANDAAAEMAKAS